MELRVMKYFIAVAKEQSITRAAELLHLSQPTLSRQLIDLEKEFGKQLLIRGKRCITLTDEGLYFYKKAEEIVSLADRTEQEMKMADTVLAGNIYIGTGESSAIRNLIHTAKQLTDEYPAVHFHFTSGDSDDLLYRLDKGFFDFCVIYGNFDKNKYNNIPLPYNESWGVLMNSNMELAKAKSINTSSLWDKPLILSRNTLNDSSYFKWLGKPKEELDIVGTYNLIYNAAFMAEEKMGYVITLESLINTEGRELCFKPIEPNMTIPISIVWKKHRPMSKASQKFIDIIP